MRYKITLSYDGSAFSGWQIQTNAPSVQQSLEKALSTLLQQEIKVVGAGRTDAGVNAINYVAHFDCDRPFAPEQLCYKMNAILPRQIAVHSIICVADNFHARFDALRRQYKYYIHSEKDPFKAAYSWYCRWELDYDKMNSACLYLLGEHDCRCFEKTGSCCATSICRIFYAHWEDGVFTIEANRFLRNMVRAIVGTMVDIGRGVHEPEYIREILDGRGTRGDAGQSVPGHALFLTGVEYPTSI